ncbi:putative zinc finger, CCHC-type containing protein [Tanacetum coccineum]
MNPDHYQLAKEECEQLVSQSIIEPTTSPWASNDKFPLQQKKSLFQHLADAKVLSKFNIKSREEDGKFGVTTINLLWHGISSDGKYQPQPHMAQELLKFPDELSSQKMIQQFLGLPYSGLKTKRSSKTIKFLQKMMPPLKILPPQKKNPTDRSSDEYGLDQCLRSFLIRTISFKMTSFLANEAPVFVITCCSKAFSSSFEFSKEFSGCKFLATRQYQLIGKFLAEFERTRKRLGTACEDKYLQIKCKDKSSCDCTHTKKKFHSKRFSSLSGKPWFSRRSSKKWKFIRKKKQRGRTSDRCFICQKKGHFARNCPDKKRSQALIQALNQVELVDVSDLESLYSLDDEPSDSVLCTIAYSDFSSDDDSDTDSLESDSDFGVHMINPIPHVLLIQEDPTLLLAKVHLLTDAYAKPIPVIAFFDTGSLVSILNPNILRDHYWKPHHQNFMAANREKFVIDKISIPINIRYVVPTGRVVVPTGRYIVPAGKVIIIVNTGRLSLVPTGRILSPDTRSLMARANGVDPDKIPYYVMWNISVWNKDHLDAYKWIEANGQWLYDNFDHCDVETSDDDDDARSLWSSDDDEHFDPFEDDPTHPDAR